MPQRFLFSTDFRLYGPVMELFPVLTHLAASISGNGCTGFRRLCSAIDCLHADIVVLVCLFQPLMELL